MPWTDLSYLTLYDSSGILFRKAGILHVDGIRTFPIINSTHPKQKLFADIKAKNYGIRRSLHMT
jgi:hypothetical protein